MNPQHQLVLSALEKLDKDRKCFRLVGDVLVERTVGETMPAVAKNKENLEATIATIQKQFELQKKDLMEFQVGGVRVRLGSWVQGVLTTCSKLSPHRLGFLAVWPLRYVLGNGLDDLC